MHVVLLNAAEEELGGAVHSVSSGWFSFRLADVRNQVIFAVRQEYVELGEQQLLLHPGDEVAIIPPISGG